MNLENILKNYGLTQKQAKIYLACLELGSGSVYKIGQKSGLPRSTCYEVLDNLKNIGLVTTFRKKNIQYFNAEDPRALIDKSQNQINLIENALPFFRSRYGNNKSTPSVRLYSGKEQIDLVLNEILNEADRLYAVSSADDLFKELDFFPEFVKRRVSKKIPIQVILKKSPKAKQRQLIGQQELREVRIMPDQFEFQAMMYLWRDKTALLSLTGNLMALVIESKEINQLNQVMFNYMWQTLK